MAMGSRASKAGAALKRTAQEQSTRTPTVDWNEVLNLHRRAKPYGDGPTSEGASPKCGPAPLQPPKPEPAPLAIDRKVHPHPLGRKPVLDSVQALGHAVWLMMQSAQHRDVTLDDLRWRVMPALGRKQFRLWHKRLENGDLEPVAYASWALLDDEAMDRVKSGAPKIDANDWDSGKAPCIMDIIAPHGHREQVNAHLQKRLRKKKSRGPSRGK